MKRQCVSGSARGVDARYDFASLDNTDFFAEFELSHQAHPFKEDSVRENASDRNHVKERIDSLSFECSESGSDRFKDVPISNLLVLEVFAGTARLTQAVNATGLRGLAYDKTQGRAEAIHFSI